MTPPPLTFNAWLRYDLIERALEDIDVRSVLEIGAGGGAMGARLAERFDYVGLEPDPDSFATARERIAAPGLGRVLNGDLSALEADETFDLVCAFEVLEHIEDDVGALTQWRARVRPGGWLLLSVPAYQRRFGPCGSSGSGTSVGTTRSTCARCCCRRGSSTRSSRCTGSRSGTRSSGRGNIMARRTSNGDSMSERTAESGRWLQLPEGAANISRLATAPFRVVQRGFVDGRLGTGLVVLAARGA